MIMLRNSLLFLFFLLMGFSAQCQSDTLAFKSAIQRLIVLGDSVLKGSNDSVKMEANMLFSDLLDSILYAPKGNTLSFHQVKSLSVAQDPDKKLKAITWLISTNNGNNYEYFGYLITQIPGKAATMITKLHQNKELQREELETLKGDSSTWMGCIYYSVIVERYKKKDYFILLGWAPQSLFITRKMIEVIGLSNQKIHLGLPQIKAGGKAKTRLIFDYNAQVTMSLRKNEKENMIVMDHLSPSDSRPEAKGMYQLYGPDLSYDGLKFSKGQWLLQRDIDVRNK